MRRCSLARRPTAAPTAAPSRLHHLQPPCHGPRHTMLAVTGLHCGLNRSSYRCVTCSFLCCLRSSTPPAAPATAPSSFPAAPLTASLPPLPSHRGVGGQLADSLRCDHQHGCYRCDVCSLQSALMLAQRVLPRFLQLLLPGCITYDPPPQLPSHQQLTPRYRGQLTRRPPA